jgi:hypothetical protein
MLFKTVWNRVHELKGAARMSWIEKNGSDLMIARALLSTPDAGKYLADLTDTELAFVNSKFEAHHVDQEMLAEQAQTVRTLQVIEAAWAKEQDKIAQRGGLVRGADGNWIEPATQAA